MFNDLPTILIKEDTKTNNRKAQGGGYLWWYKCSRLRPETKINTI